MSSVAFQSRLMGIIGLQLDGNAVLIHWSAPLGAPAT